MNDNSYNRAKMRGFVAGLKRALLLIHTDEGGVDGQLIYNDIKKEMEEIQKEWKIRPKKEGA